MNFVAATNQGCVRPNNEDSYYIPGDIENLFILADGMGGHLAGETASQMAIDIISEYFSHEEIDSEEKLIETFENSIHEANEKIFQLSNDDDDYRGMGTTLSMVYIFDDCFYYTNIGDSRIYEIKPDKIEQITKDDSFVNYLIQIGEINEEEALIHPKRNVLTRALGTSQNIGIDVEKTPLDKDKKYLLCSDGLTNMVSDQKILEILNNNNLTEAKTKLIEESLINGGIDNVTLIIIDNE
ncbi:Stp1/IreP family PP2C-type Ser/Thr phosphatase [Anaerosphaera multitolerans]|uniref:Stp1/IreP family PP2C-type Ser/Thr phosphatase n=1 Tax=Anaerosphaera multitolerans TaxID=2487351 RepID=A0A437S6V4_9FIRM|nr:Stp1/IreP family PP2C-type Ser/Thr phosphatase [Anaerosphaera multitolerans]RVU54759.1 Stp1/IreP family PP2C-type Ser/Thr phosphatase [Anaerosphaera multitolerans]